MNSPDFMVIAGGRYSPDELVSQTDWPQAWRCQDLFDKERLVLVKVWPSEQLSRSTRLKSEYEGQLLGLEVFQEGTDFAVVAPWHPGPSLEQRLSAGTLPVAEVLCLAERVLLRLKDYHQKGVLHGAVHPRNILWDGQEAELLYAGPRRLSPALSSVRYLSPEAAGLIPAGVDGRSDLYSLGVVLYEALTGSPPYAANELNELLRQHLLEPVPYCELEQLLQRLLAKQPEHRYAGATAALQDVVEMQEDPRQALAGPFAASTSLRTPKLSGRVQELEFLVQHVLEMQSPLLLVEGASGAGKTRLLEELSRLARAGGLRVAWAASSPENLPMPLFALQGLAELTPTLGPAPPELEEEAGVLCEAVPALRAWLPESLESPEPEAFGEERTLRALRAWLAFLSQHLQVVIFDDAQWVGPPIIRLLRSWEHEPAGPLRLIAAIRSHEVATDHPLRIRPPVHHLRLEPLTAGSVETLLSSMAGPLPPAALAQLVEVSQGNPFLAIEAIHEQIGRGALIHTPQGWLFSGGEFQTSPRATELIASRLALLPDFAREVLSTAAVLGRSFKLDLVLEASQRTSTEVFEALHLAQRHHILWANSDLEGYSFCHDRLREALEERIHPQQRREVLAAAGAYLEQLDPTRIFELARYFYEAGEWNQALGYCREAAHASRQRHALKNAEHYYRMALGCGAADWASRLGLAEVLILQGHNYEEAETILQELGKTARTAEQKANVCLKKAYLAYRCDQANQAVAACKQGLAELGRPVPKGLRLVGGVLARIMTVGLKPLPLDHPGALPDAREQILLDLYRRLSEASFEKSSVQDQLFAHLEAKRQAECFAPSIALGHHYAYHSAICASYAYYDRAELYGRRSLEILSRHGTRHDLAIGLVWVGIAWYYMGRLSEAETTLTDAGRNLERAGDLWEKFFLDSVLASCLYSQGRLRESSQLCQRLRENAPPQAATRALHYLARVIGASIPEGAAEQETRREGTGSFHRLEAWQARGCQLLSCAQYELAAEAFEKARRAGGPQIHNLTCHIPASLATCWRLAFEARSQPQARRRADRYAREAARIGKRFPLTSAHSFREMALACARAGKAGQARVWLERSQNCALRYGLRYELAVTLSEIGRLGEVFAWPRARQDRAQAEAILDQLGVDWQVPGGLRREPASFTSISLQDRFTAVLEEGRRLTRALHLEEIKTLSAAALGRLVLGEHCQVVDVGQVPAGMSPSLVARVLASGQPGLEPMAEGRTQVCAPILVEGQVQAFLHGRGILGAQELHLAEFVASLSGAAWENAGVLERARATEQRFQTVFEEAGVGLMIVDGLGLVVEGNPLLREMLGVPLEDLLGQPFAEQIWPADREQEVERFRQLVTGSHRSYRAELRCRRLNGQPAWIQLSVARIGPNQYLRALQDVSQRRLREVVRFQELESQILSLELHDGLAQELIALQLHADNGAEVRRLAAQAGSQLRQLMGSLKNPVLSGEDPFRAVARLARQPMNPPVRLRIDSPCGLPWLTGVFLYRIVQECLQNVQRHAQASQAWVRLSCRDGRVHGRVRDNGRGLQPGPRSMRFGLRGIRQRARLLGGSVRVRSREGRGVCVSFSLPFREEVSPT